MPETETVVDAEVVPENPPPEEQELPPAAPPASTAIAVVEPRAGAIIAAENPDEIIVKATQIANALKGLIDGQNLAASMGGGRKHVEVGAWQACGTLLGALGGQPLHAETVWTRRVMGEDGHPIRTQYTATVKRYHRKDQGGGVREETTYDVDGHDWEACVEVKTPSGVIVGRAEAMVSRTEETWSRRDDYAVRSMAETRAESRAWRKAIGWVVHMAGYNPTPAEEMGGGSNVPPAELPAWTREATDERKKQLVTSLTVLLGSKDAALAVCKGAKQSIGVVPDVLVAFARGMVAVKSAAPDTPAETPAPAQTTMGDQLDTPPPEEPPAEPVTSDAVEAPFPPGDRRWKDARAQAEQWCKCPQKLDTPDDDLDPDCAVHGIPF